MLDFVLAALLVVSLSACTRKDIDPFLPSGFRRQTAESPSNLDEFRAQVAKDAAFKQKLGSSEGLNTLTPEEKIRLNEELAGGIFTIIDKGDFQAYRILADVDPNLGMKPFDPNARSHLGDTFLMASVRSGSPEFVKEFLRKGTDPSLKDADGRTALDLAREAKRSDLAALLSATK